MKPWPMHLMRLTRPLTASVTPLLSPSLRQYASTNSPSRSTSGTANPAAVPTPPDGRPPGPSPPATRPVPTREVGAAAPTTPTSGRSAGPAATMVSTLNDRPAEGRLNLFT